MLGQIWMETVWHSGGIPERIKKKILKKSADTKKLAKLLSRQKSISLTQM